VLKVQKGGERKRLILAPPYIEIAGYRIPLDILAFVCGLLLIFFNQPIALLTQIAAGNLRTVGQALLALGAIMFILGRIK